MIKTTGSFLVEPLTGILNSCFSTSTFPDLAKRASVTPIDKGDTDKDIYTNYRPVSVLNTFSKIIESSIFDQLTKYANDFLETFVGAYRKLYSSQHNSNSFNGKMKNTAGQKQNSWSGVT